MKINSFYADGFRNLSGVKLKFHPKLNILCGKNAQGKTNALEGIWLCTGERSFRSAKDKELIRKDGEKFCLGLEFSDKRRTQKIAVECSRRDIRNKKVTLNGVPLKTTSALFGAFECVVFTPEDLELSKGSPEVRRSYADSSIAMIKTSYRKVTDKYKRILEQRNNLLKSIALKKADVGQLEIWDMQLAQMGSYITILRYNFCKKLQRTAGKLYEEISSGKEKLDIKYRSSVFDKLEGRLDYKNDLAAEYLRKLEESRAEDIRCGFTMRGVHRDDLCFYINDMYVKDYASQGQHRSAALVMKLAQAYILSEETNDPPCILLDDVLSELDELRQEFVMKKIRDMQVIITCCDEEMIRKGLVQEHGKIFYAKNGKFSSEK